MNFLQDHITFVIDKRYEDTTKSGIIGIDSSWIDPEENERYIHKRIYGHVVSVPSIFSESPVTAIDPGLPASKKFVGHDWIADKINRGYKTHSKKDYYPSTFDEYDVVTVRDIAALTDIQVNDRVYFDEKVTEDDNLLGKIQGKEHFKCRVDEVICTVRAVMTPVYNQKGDRIIRHDPSKAIIMQGGWVLVEPNMESWEEITGKYGIILKPRPEVKALEGWIRHIRPRYDMKPGMKILYIKDADWTIKVEGKEYYAIQEKDILCEID